MSGSRQIIKDSARFLAATIVSHGVGLIRGLVIPVLLTPAQLGVWSMMGVILGYGGNAHLGILHGMNKAIPLRRGQEQREEAEAIKDSVFWLNLLLGAVAAGIVWAASFAAPVSYASALRIITIGVFLQIIFFYLFSLLRADNRFGLVSQGVGALSILSTVLIVFLALTLADPLLGALIGLVAAYALVVVYWLSRGRYRFTVRLSRGPIREALRMGVPLVVLGVLDTLFLSIDRWVIAVNLGETTLGYYALGAMASNLIGLVPGAVATVLYPRTLERFAATSDPGAVRSLLTGPLRATAALMLVLIGGATLGLPLLVQIFLPKYLPSVPILEILIPAAFLYSIANITGTWMVAVDRQHLLMAVLITAGLLSLLVDYVLLWAGYGVLGVVLGTVVGYSLYGLGYMVLAVHLAFGQKAETARFLAGLLIPFVVMVLAIVVAGVLIEEGQTPLGYLVVAAKRLALVMSALLPVLWLVNRDGELIRALRRWSHT